ncbi:aldose 1-epimerase family protein [Arthrobacter sp. KN11-1C]|uniref:aldose 1-epimerase family protein n=1 Tax=Arthrobacter sp. KN11-1C TaxID=3445774 RepID=UPI003FA0DA7D
MQVQLQTDRLRAVLDSQGAELVSLQDNTGRELLWTAGPEWPRHAPILFPVIGRLVSDVLRHRGTEYPMTQHGFARDCGFAVLEATDQTVRFLLSNSPATEAMFPYPFSLEIDWSLDGPSLDLAITLTNTGKEHLPASLGWHPAFRWDPTPGWHLLFDAQETDKIRRVNANVQLKEAADPTPVRDKILPLTEDEFAHGAIIFESLQSRTIRYISPTGPVFDLAFAGFTHFTVWKQTGANFICLEPWAGLPVLASYRGEALTSPGQMLLQPGARRQFNCRLTADGWTNKTETTLGVSV